MRCTARSRPDNVTYWTPLRDWSCTKPGSTTARAMAQWTAMNLDVSRWKAERWLGAGRAFDRLPATAEALATGDIGIDKVLELARPESPATRRPTRTTLLAMLGAGRCVRRDPSGRRGSPRPRASRASPARRATAGSSAAVRPLLRAPGRRRGSGPGHRGRTRRSRGALYDADVAVIEGGPVIAGPTVQRLLCKCPGADAGGTTRRHDRGPGAHVTRAVRLDDAPDPTRGRRPQVPGVRRAALHTGPPHRVVVARRRHRLRHLP